MKFKLEYELTGLPKSPDEMNPVAKARAEKGWRLMSARGARSATVDRPTRKIQVTCIRFSSAPMDIGKLALTFRPIIDGLKDAGIIGNDDYTITQENFFWVKAPRKAGRVRVTVEEI